MQILLHLRTMLLLLEAPIPRSLPHEEIKAGRVELSVVPQPGQHGQARCKSILNKVCLKYVKQFKNQQEMKMLFGENYTKFVEANLKKETLLEYIVNSFTSVSKEIYKTYKKLDYE
jgi:hypothetical protein